MNAKALNLYFDASVLGMAQYDMAARTGIYRVVDALFLALLKSDDINLNVTVTEGLEVKSHLLKYLEEVEFAKTHSLPLRTGLAQLYGILEQTRNKITATPDLFHRAGNQFLWKTMCFLKKWNKDLPQFHENGIFHSTFWKIPEFIQNDKKLIKILTIYDLWPILSNNSGEKEQLTHIFNSLPADGWAICISEKTRQDLLNFRKDLDPNKVKVTHLAYDSSFHSASSEEINHVRRQVGLGDWPYFLTIGTFSERKNLPLVLNAFFAALESGKLKSERLVLVGAKKDELHKALNFIPNAAKYSNQIVSTGYMDDSLLPALYTGALAFLYPSLYEGFGIPILEAMACQTPVLTTSAGSIPEVSGNAAILLPTHDIEAWVNSLDSIATNNSLREQKVKLGLENCKRFSWDKCSQSTKDIYRLALSA